MKQGRSLITLVMVVIAAALAIYLGFYVYNTLTDPVTTTLAYTYTTYDSLQADGFLVREETVFPPQTGIVDLTRSEGERVGVNQTVAMVYRDSQAQADQAQLETIQEEIDLLIQAAADSGSVESAARLDEDILQSVVALRGSAALGDFSRLEEQVLDVKSGVLKRGYTYGDGLTAQDLTARLKELRGEYNDLTRRTAAATTRVKAPQSGTFSLQVDGYESQLTPALVTLLRPSDLDHLMADYVEEEGMVGKLVTSRTWSFLAPIPAEAAARLKVGDKLTLAFAGDFTQDVEMEVTHLSETEDDQVLVLLSTDRYLEQTTLLRRQTVQIIFNSWTGLRVPKGAVHLDKTTQTDKDTGEETETSTLVVYVRFSGRMEKKPVEVVHEGKDYYVLSPAEGAKNPLRPGDEVIVSGVGLYDGQVIS